MSRREKKHRTGAFPAQKQMVNNQSLKGCPPKGSCVKVRNDQSERIVEILTEYVTKEWTDEDKRWKNVDVLTSRQRVGENVHPRRPRGRPRSEMR